MTSPRQLERGFALAYALFLVLILYAGMTVMMANLRSDLRTSQRAFRATQFRFASQGAVNKLYVLLRNGADPQDYTEEIPLAIDIGGFEAVKAWVVEDDDAGVFHLVSQFRGTFYSRVVTKKDDGGSRIYVNNGGTLVAASPDDTSWTALPTPPKKVYDSDRQLVDCPDLSCFYSPRANSKGQLAAIYTDENHSLGRAVYLWDEGSQSWGDVTPPSSVLDALHQNFWEVNHNPLALGNERLYYWDFDYSDNSAFAYYDLATGQWSDAIPGPYNGATIENGFVGPNETFVAEVRPNGTPQGVQFVNGQWSDLAPLPNNVPLGRLNADGPNGEIYATGADVQFYKLKDGVWTTVAAPESSQNLLSVDANEGLIFLAPGMELILSEPSSEPARLPELENPALFGLAGGGSPKESGDSSFRTTATY